MEHLFSEGLARDLSEDTLLWIDSMGYSLDWLFFGQGAMLKKIGSNARYEIERMLESKVNLKLWVKVKKDWRDSDFLIKNFGYDKKEI